MTDSEGKREEERERERGRKRWRETKRRSSSLAIVATSSSSSSSRQQWGGAIIPNRPEQQARKRAIMPSFVSRFVHDMPRCSSSLSVVMAVLA